jgi:hypothetical protein
MLLQTLLALLLFCEVYCGAGMLYKAGINLTGYHYLPNDK